MIHNGIPAPKRRAQQHVYDRHPGPARVYSPELVNTRQGFEVDPIYAAAAATGVVWLRHNN
ncbi:MAG: hypothetical protein M3436_11305 [Pseudomonadota bacterium]|nr:hypothetical protein [Pseudomonadota bacterium]